MFLCHPVGVIGVATLNFLFAAYILNRLSYETASRDDHTAIDGYDMSDKAKPVQHDSAL